MTWIFAASRQTIIQSSTDLARKLGLLEKGPSTSNHSPVIDLFDWFNAPGSPASNGHWLIIIDNLDFPSLLDESLTSANRDDANTSYVSSTLLEVLPLQQHESQQILVTTRSQDVAVQFDPQIIQVDVLDITQARQLFTSRLNTTQLQADPSVMDILLTRMGYLPLAISQAAAYIARNRLSPQDYLQRLGEDDKNHGDYLSIEIQDPRRPRGWPSSVYLSWKLSFDEIKRVQPLAFEFLSLLAFLDTKHISRTLLQQQGTRLQESLESTDSDDELSLTRTQADVDMALGTLLGYSLAASGESSDLLTTHALVAACIRNWLSFHGDYDKVLQNVFMIIVAYGNGDEYDSSDFLEFWRVHWRPLALHARAALRYVRDNAHASAEQGFSMLLLTMWEMMEGSPSAGLQWATKMQTLFANTTWNTDTEEALVARFLISITRLYGAILHMLDRQDERLQVLLSARTTWSTKVPPSTRGLADLNSNIVNALVKLQRLEEADAIADEVENIMVNLDESDNYGLSSLHAMRAEIATARKDFQAAQKHILDAIDLSSKENKSFGSQAWNLKSVLCTVMLRAGKAEEALGAVQGMLPEGDITQIPAGLQAIFQYVLVITLWCSRRYVEATEALEVLLMNYKEDAALCSSTSWLFYENMRVGLKAEMDSLVLLGSMPNPWIMRPRETDPSTVSFWNYATQLYADIDPRISEEATVTTETAKTTDITGVDSFDRVRKGPDVAVQTPSTADMPPKTNVTQLGELHEIVQDEDAQLVEAMQDVKLASKGMRFSTVVHTLRAASIWKRTVGPQTSHAQ